MPRTNSLLPTPRAPKARTSDPVHPNVGVQAWYQRQLEKVLLQMGRDALKYVQGAYEESGLAPVLIAKDAKSPVLFLQKSMSKWAQRWVSCFDAMSQRLATQFADRSFAAAQQSMKANFKKAGWTVEFKPTPASVEAYRATIAENVNLIRSIPQQYLKDVQSQVWASAMKGGDLHDLSVNLKKKYNVTAKRAALIARDQNAKAKAIIERTRQTELGIKYAIWQHSSGGKEPRPTHVHNSGKRFKVSTGWYDPDANGKGKGEWVWPGTLINCRCTSRSILPWEQGG